VAGALQQRYSIDIEGLKNQALHIIQVRSQRHFKPIDGVKSHTLHNSNEISRNETWL
jgi:hypothetical protein